MRVPQERGFFVQGPHGLPCIPPVSAAVLPKLPPQADAGVERKAVLLLPKGQGKKGKAREATLRHSSHVLPFPSLRLPSRSDSSRTLVCKALFKAWRV